jgi:aspartyl-tRNA synthetase
MQGTGFGIFENVLQNGGEVVALPLLNFELSRKQVEDTNRMAKDCGLPGIIACKWEGGNFSTPLSKYLLPERIPQIADRLELKERTATVLFAAGKNPQTLLALGQLRLKLSAYIEKKPGFQCLWITDFPLFEVDADGRITSTHHPFTSPKTEDLHLLEISPLKVRSRAYDLVINGYEIASGSIRIHQRELQEQVFSQLGIDRGAANEKFGFLLKAFEYGVPPHGGIAFGFDRLLMLLCGAESIREVMPFPKTTSGISLMDGSPSPVTEEQLQELGLILLKSS